MSSAAVVDEKLPGIQLALFELIWPAFEWIDSIHVKADSSTCFVHVQAAELPGAAEQADCERLIGEIFEAVLAGTPLRLKVTQIKHAPAESGYREAISGDIFKMIAKDVAPWRLDAGR
jgi:hypothetical protein